MVAMAAKVAGRGAMSGVVRSVWMKTHQLRACPACAGESATPIDLGEDRMLRRCTACRLVYAPEYADPSEIYVDGYLRGGTDFGLDIMHPLFQQFLDFAARRRMTMLERHVGGAGSLLDVGCGAGEVLHAAVDRGWTAVGCEPVAESAAIARQRGLDVRTALLEESDIPPRSFDVVSAVHVLEHMTDGTGFLRSIGRWARPGGHVMIEVPNWRSVHRRAKGAQWPGLRPLEHIAHYGPRTLAGTMRRAGLAAVTVRTTGFLWPEGQTLAHALDDLAVPGLRRWMRGPLVREGDHKGTPALVPTRAGWAVLRATQRAYDLGRVGQVVIGIGRVPSTFSPG